MEVALLGRQGLEINDPDKRYQLNSLGCAWFRSHHRLPGPVRKACSRLTRAMVFNSQNAPVRHLPHQCHRPLLVHHGHPMADALVAEQGCALFGDWICMGLLVPVPWNERPWALPFLTRLASSKRADEAARRRHRTVVALTIGMVSLVARWLKQRRWELLGDGRCWFSSFAYLPSL